MPGAMRQIVPHQELNSLVLSKTIVITGASDGIGAAAARQLAADGHRLILLGRSPEKTKAIADELGAQAIVADFARLDDVCLALDQILAATSHIDVLVHNAGLISGKTRVVTEDGFELTNQVNYLAPFLLDHLLLPFLLTSHATVVATSSLAHWMGRINLNDLDHTTDYASFRAYGTSKLALLMHIRELQRRYGGDGVNGVAFHPGIVSSNFSHGSGTWIERFYIGPLKVLLPTTPAKAANTLVFLAEGASQVDFPPGGYIVRRKPALSRAISHDVRAADALWRRTEQVLGL